LTIAIIVIAIVKLIALSSLQSLGLLVRGAGPGQGDLVRRVRDDAGRLRHVRLGQ